MCCFLLDCSALHASGPKIISCSPCMKHFSWQMSNGEYEGHEGLMANVAESLERQRNVLNRDETMTVCNAHHCRCFENLNLPKNMEINKVFEPLQRKGGRQKPLSLGVLLNLLLLLLLQLLLKK